jgi:hypothetical protein
MAVVAVDGDTDRDGSDRDGSDRDDENDEK